jgi:hypothetical protein
MPSHVPTAPTENNGDTDRVASIAAMACASRSVTAPAMATASPTIAHRPEPASSAAARPPSAATSSSRASALSAIHGENPDVVSGNAPAVRPRPSCSSPAAVAQIPEVRVPGTGGTARITVPRRRGRGRSAWGDRRNADPSGASVVLPIREG